jgi:quercetin dioxygenase-like cupin family protein
MMSAAPVEVIELELKKPGAGKTVSKTLDPLKVDPKHYKLEMENDQVRVTRVRFGVNEGAPMHEHVLSRVVVYLTDARTKVTAADGTVTESSYKAGDVVYGGAAKHSEVNVSGHPIEIVVTELKY